MLQNNTFIKRDETVTFKITPDFSVNNGKNEIITSAITNIYENPSRRISLSNINYKKPSRVFFNIVLENRNASFYITVPKTYEDLFEGKMSSCWKKSAIDKIEDNSFLKLSSKTTVGGELHLKDYNFKGIATSLSDSSHLNSLFQLMRSMGKDDKVVINIAIEPMPRHNWLSIVQDETKKDREGKPKISQDTLSDMVVKKGFEGATLLADFYLEYRFLMFETILGMMGDEDSGNLISRDSKKFPTEERLAVRGSSGSSYKKNSDVAKCKITILSSSLSESKANIHLLSVVESYKELNDDNEFFLKPLSTKQVARRIQEVKLNDVSPNNQCILSTKELAKLIQLPPKQAQRDFKIKAIDELEGEVSKELLQGDVPMAITKIRGREFIVYRSNDKSIRCLPWISVGSQNVGKTTLMKRIAYENYKMGDSNLIIDTIEDCKIAKACRQLIPNDKRVDINVSLTNINNIPSFSFNEISSLITEDMDRFTRISLASDIAEQVQLIIENVSDDTNGHLTDAMVRYLYSACLVTFIRPNATLNDVFNVLRIPDIRHKAILYARSTKCFDDEEIFLNLYQLDKEIKVKEIQLNEHGEEVEVPTTKIINNDQAIVGINNRLTQLEKVPYVKRMLKQKPRKDENFLKYIEEGKTIVVSVPQHDFKSKKIRDMIGLYYFSRIWLAVQSRKDNENATPCHIFFDEVYTIPSTLKLLEEHITEFRRHRLGFFTSCHHLGQFGDTLTSFKSAGGNYILFSSAEKNSFNLLKEEVDPFELEDLMRLKEHHAIVVQRGKDGYSRYIGRIPDFLEDLSNIQNAKKKD